jgi:hypothetical protein
MAVALTLRLPIVRRNTGAGSMIGVDQSKTFLTTGSFRLQKLKQLALLD